MLLVPRLQALMVCADRDRMQGYVPGPLSEGHDNGIRLLLPGRPCPPVAFRQDSAPECHRHVPPIAKHLLQHGTNGVVGGVRSQEKPSVRIHKVQTHCG